MSPLVKTILLLIASNTFMTLAWYAHLKEMPNRPLMLAALFSWGLAFFEYLFFTPAMRIGHSEMNFAQLKILEEVVSLVVFMPIAIFYLKQNIRLDYLWASLCLIGAAYFMFRGGLRLD
jgi:uncharacterized protein